jgi:hypothetical protein
MDVGLAGGADSFLSVPFDFWIKTYRSRRSSVVVLFADHETDAAYSILNYLALVLLK